MSIAEIEDAVMIGGSRHCRLCDGLTVMRRHQEV